MSFNIRYATAPDGENQWWKRRTAALNCIRSINPDLIGIQECRADGQLNDLLGGLPDYGWHGVPRGGQSEAAQEMAPVFYRKDRFKLLDQGVFWLSDTPDVPGSRSWDAALPRTVAWVLLAEAGRQIWFANAHFDHMSWEARLKSAALLGETLASRQVDEIKLVTGDFNTSKDTEPYEILTGFLPDTFRDPRLGLRPAEGSFHAFGALDPPEPIDWVLASPELVPARAWVENGRVGERWLSDHHPVVVTFRST